MGTGERRCGCCGRWRPENQVAELGATPGVYICTGCALWAARRAGLSGLLHRRGTPRPATPAVRATVPVLGSTDLDRTAAFYALPGFAVHVRADSYLALDHPGGELHATFLPAVTAAD
ncbi:hypothetical protein [Dactylosporangium sp. NPDC051541]|uniref:hypothetical protein n=1 Tax=Dactylosporangium sp. NPDC051541 TaxID=3363977 RepID=UPI00378FFEAC